MVILFNLELTLSPTIFLFKEKNGIEIATKHHHECVLNFKIQTKTPAHLTVECAHKWMLCHHGEKAFVQQIARGSTYLAEIHEHTVDATVVRIKVKYWNDTNTNNHPGELRHAVTIREL